MLDHTLENALAEFLRSALDGVHVATGHEDESRILPLVTISSKSDSLAGSATVFRADVSLTIESESHDSKPNEHAALVEKVRLQFADKFVATTTINARGGVHIYGYAFAGSSIEVDGARFRTTLSLKVGYGS